jgi:tricorn protease
MAWVQRNLDEVTKRTNGEVGYIHIPTWGSRAEPVHEAVLPADQQEGAHRRRAREWRRLRFTAGDRPPRRELVMVNVARNGMPSENPQQTFLGPMVTLMNEFSSSMATSSRSASSR